MFVRLYKTVRPHLEYCIVAWRPSKKKETYRLDRIKRIATKQVPQLRYMNYESRLANLGSPSLEERRPREDLIQYFKLPRGLNQVNWFYGNMIRNQLIVSASSSCTKGSQHGLCPQFTKIET